VSRWLPVPGYEGLYEVSDSGQVRGRKSKALKPFVNRSGHLSVTLLKNKHRQLTYVHRLVLIAFVGQPPHGTEARHYPDRDPSNCCLDNLSWATRAVNVRDRIKHRTNAKKLTLEIVRAIRSGTYANQADAARVLGVDPTTISQILLNKTWKENPMKNDAYLTLIKALTRMQRQADDVLNPPEGERLDYLVNQVMDSAHEILDLAYEFKQAAHLTNA
jgi:NUMOD4 motif/HNH endonuclease